MAATGSRKAILAALIANSGIAVAKFLGFLVTRSSAMLAEAVHSVADVSNQGLLLFGGRRSRRQPTATHPFGYGRERYFWSFVVAVVLFSLGSAFAVYEGIEKVRHPHEIHSVSLALAILGTGIVLEAWSFRTAIVAALPERRGLSWRKFILQTRPSDCRGRREPLGGHRPAPVGRGGNHPHRSTAGGHRYRPGPGDEKPPDRRVGRRWRPESHPRRHRGNPRHLIGSPPPYSAPGSGRDPCWSTGRLGHQP